MKKKLLPAKILGTMGLTLFLMAPLQAQTPVVNGTFESWSSPVLFQRPSNWFTDVNPTSAPSSTVRVNEFTQGSYALKLTTVEEQGNIPNPVPVGYAVLGEFIYTFPPKGIPWNHLVDEFKMDLKYDIKPGDAGVVWVRMTKNGNVISNKLQTIIGSQSSWTTLTLDLFDGAAVAADSIMIAIGSSLPEELSSYGFTPKTGSWVTVDNLRFSYQANTYNVPNYSFENWEGFSIEEPDNWTSSNMMLTYDETTNVKKTTEAHSGAYAAQLTTVPSILSNAPVPGLLSYGNGLLSEGGVTYSDNPKFLTGAYNYQPVGSDNAYIEVYFTRGGSVLATNQLNLISAGSVDAFFLPTNLPSGSSPEKVFINISSGTNTGSSLKVDDIQLVNVSTGIEDALEEKTGVYPNPFGEVIYLKNAQKVKRVTLSTLSGQIVADFLTSGSKSSFNTGSLAPGQYLITIETLDGRKVSEVVIKN